MIIKNLVRDNVKALKPYASARQEYINKSDGLVYLDANESPFNNGLNRYPDPQSVNVKSILAFQKNIQTENIFLGNGSDEILDLIFRVFCEPNKDNIITLPPTYGMYEVLASLNAIEIKRVLLNKNFQPQVTEILSIQDENSKLLFLCSPNNPTANSFNIELIDKLLKKFKGIVIVDEAYIDFSQKNSWVSRLAEFPNLIVIQTLSKAYGLAGIRLGACYASKYIVSVLNKIKPPYNINQLTQNRALEKLQDVTHVYKEINILLKEREQLFQQLSKISFVKTIYPSDANFILVKVDNADKRYLQLIKKGIIVRNRTNQVLCNNCLRFTVGTEIENKRLITILKQLL